MASKIWEEIDSNVYIPACLESYTEPVQDKVYVMFHGTTKQNAVLIKKNGFKPSENGMLGRGIYVSRDIQKASRYPLDIDENQRYVLKLHVHVGRVKKIDRQGHPMQKTWHEKGYDTAWVPPNCGMVPSGLEEDCVWDPWRIRVIEIMNPSLVRQILHEQAIRNQPFAPERMLYAQNYLGSVVAKLKLKGIDRKSLPGEEPVASFDSPDTERIDRLIALSRFESKITFLHIFLQSLTEPEENNVYVMFHGTARQNAQLIKRNGFQPSQDGMLGKGVYVSRDIQKASKYPIQVDPTQRVVLKLNVNVGKVVKIDRQGHPLQKSWHSYGYDTAWVPPNCGMVLKGLEEDCIWDPSRIRVIEVMAPSSVPSLTEPEDHKVHVMFHGTTRDNADLIRKNGFRPSQDHMLETGVYVSRDIQKASRYPIQVDPSQWVVLKLNVNVGKVVKIDRQGHPLQKSWHSYGYDTAWMPPNCGMVPSGLEEHCIWDPSRIQVIEVMAPL
ncbi:uncharacterized protein LOC120528866 [Polypterus senegalus]|uniref:uncharacterized protein LOC120528866 n=1 Tax=Polypterus senegalus TaxID=55291 RepID=UPI0019624FB5|nr:uncharacterized protein LOC120528866 [Polypterus senegalus]